MASTVTASSSSASRRLLCRPTAPDCGHFMAPAAKAAAIICSPVSCPRSGPYNWLTRLRAWQGSPRRRSAQPSYSLAKEYRLNILCPRLRARPAPDPSDICKRDNSDICIWWRHYRARSFAAIRGAVRCRLRCSGPAIPGCACPLHAAAATAAVRTAADIRPAIVRISSGRRLSLPRCHRDASAERQQEDQRGEPRELDLADIGRETGAARHSARIASVARKPKSFGLLHSLL